MSPCMETTGFFVLGRCGRPSVTACPRCRKPVCDRHAAGGGLCPECTVALGYGAQGHGGSPYDPFWTSGYRGFHYHSSGSAYSDPGWYATFDDYDRGAFDVEDQGDFGDMDDSDFVDS